MVERAVQSWPILKLLGTPVSPAPGNTCGCPSLVVSDRQCYLLWLRRYSLQQSVKVSHFLFSPPVSSGRRGSRVNRSFLDFGLHTRWERETACFQVLEHAAWVWLVSELFYIQSMVWAQTPFTCRWMVHWPHLQASKCALYQLSGDHWKNMGYVQGCL